MSKIANLNNRSSGVDTGFVGTSLDALSSHVAIIDGSGTILNVNLAWRSFVDANGLGLANHGLGVNYIEVFAACRGCGDPDVTRAADGIREVLANRRDSFSMDYSCFGADEKRWFQLRAARLADDGLARVVVIHEDITEIKAAQAALKKSEERLRLLLETSNAIPWEADASTWRFTYVGPQAVRFLGYPLEQWFEADFWTSHIHPEDRSTAINSCLSYSESTNDFEFEYRMIGSSGKTVWIHDIVSVESLNGAPRTLRGFMIDITERKQLEETLKRQHDFLRQVIDIDPNFIFAKDRQGRFTLVNQAVADAYGTTVDNLVGKTDSDFNSSATEVEFFRNMDLSVMETLEERIIPEERITDAQGNTRWLQTVKRPIIGEDGLANQVLGASTDITARRRAELEIQERFQFEKLISTVSAKLANVAAEAVDSAIEDGLRLLGEFFDADRCAIIEFSRDGTKIRSSHRWHSHRVRPQKRLSTPILSATLGEAWKRGETVVFVRLEDIPKEQKALREAIMRAGFKSHLSVPLQVGGVAVGALGITTIFEEREWSPEVVQRFKTIGEIFANAMTRKRAEEALKQLSGRLIHAHEESRRRLARELHDDVSQRLAVIAIEAGKLEQQSHYTPEFIHGKLQGMKEQIVRLAGDIHRISRQLHPSILDDLGIVDAMESECQRFSDVEGIPVKFSADRIPGGVPKDVALCLYRVTQEALRNIAKHSKTTEASVTLRRKKGEVLVKVTDRGVGFDPGRTRRKLGLGLASMEERVRLIRGKFLIHSAPGKGTSVEIKVPLVRSEKIKNARSASAGRKFFDSTT